MKKIYLFILFVFLYTISYATHNRAGEITYRQLGPLTFEITVWTYTSIKPGVSADRDELEVFWGDNTSTIVPRVEKTDLANYYRRNRYVWIHTYPGAGTYEIKMSDPNRNEGVRNIPNSVDVLFTIKTILQVNPFLGSNSTPILMNPPFDKGYINRIFVHNPAAYDPDGDSLSYKISVCFGDNGAPIEGYTFPSAKNSLRVDAITGDLIWDYPLEQGIYNVAIQIEEWRKGIKIGSLVRDMQIEVYDSDNHPPVIDPLKNICATAGEKIEFTVTANDQDNDWITLTAYGGPFKVGQSPAIFNMMKAFKTVSSIFTWQTQCSHVRKQPYTVTFKAEDDYPDYQMVDLKNVNFQIVAPAVTNLTAEASNSSILLKWSPNVCNQAIGYKIYRKQQKYNFIPDECETGVPARTGYELIGEIKDYNTTSFLDDNKGKGLTQGYQYCYMVVAYFSDGAESYASIEVCKELVRGIPLITKVSVEKTDPTNGIIKIEWQKPLELDLTVTPGPFRYALYPSDDLYGNAFRDPFYVYGIDNTSYTDNTAKTKDFPRIYKMGLFNQDAVTGEWRIIGVPENAASIFLTLKPKNKKIEISLGENVPWKNYSYDIYRKKAGDADYILVGTTTTLPYIDQGLTNGEEYWYYVKSTGQYDLTNIPRPLINLSQEASAIPVAEPPCPPVLKVTSNCTALVDTLKWSMTVACKDDVVKYRIYYSPTMDGNLVKIDSIESVDANQYIFKGIETLAGCFVVTAVNSFGLESPRTNKTCIDDCIYYYLPNVFTPDGDGINDIYKPFPYKFVEKINLKIYTRWGNLVYETENPDINWDGKDKSGKLVSDGVYYYICDVFEKRITGTEPRNISGFIHVYGTNKSSKP